MSSPLVGSTVFGDGRPGSSLSQLNHPWGITVNGDNSMLITDLDNGRVLQVAENASVGIIAAPGSSWLHSRRAYFDAVHLTLYVIESNPCQMRRYYNGSSLFAAIFGGTCGANTILFGNSASFCLDSIGNFYVADNYNHRIMFWAANTTNGTLLAGVTGVIGNDTSHLYHPQDITLDEGNRFMYVADTFNHRILRYSFGNPNSTVAAGGNGPGVASKYVLYEKNYVSLMLLLHSQLNAPSGFYLSQSTNILYIADTLNHRIVRWPLDASEGITITGKTYLDCIESVTSG